MLILSNQLDKHTRKDDRSVSTNYFIWYISNKICYSGRVYTQMKTDQHEIWSALTKPTLTCQKLSQRKCSILITILGTATS